MLAPYKQNAHLGHKEANRAGIRDYMRIARFDHMTKQIFIIPGIAAALMLRPHVTDQLYTNLIIGFAAAVAIASANYVINEWLDREFDAHHPEKSQRAAVQTALDVRVVYGFYAALLAAGLALAASVNQTFLAIAVVFAIAGILYNVRPFRTKDRVVIDVLSESLNNPLRLMLGWTMVDPGTLPPISLLMAFWFGGAFLMNSKRLAEFREIVATRGRETLELYRPSFALYSENSLSVANLAYALACAFFIAIFAVKYRIEYILLFPLLVALFAEYYLLTLRPASVARAPEKLFKARRLMLLSGLAGAVAVLTTFVDIPILDRLTDQHFIELMTTTLPAD
ncbi:UbiA family prenyltransferase [Roseinatronobacter sp.]|uniref:UbiA family prenyltransferase n=1 Tax=Roseinatronobacter sp. TaxID=1945755 RepID=UPI0025DEC369|nr:UbiA family prenyltransferase [Rhodobaca sp.]